MASAVLFSGGLDSAVLLAMESRDPRSRVHAVHVRAGLAWEDAESRAIQRLLTRPPFAGRVESVTTLALDMRDIYPATHWAITGTPPAYDTPDEDVYLDGRNIVLTAKAAVLAARIGADRLVLGTLAGNPFPDATPDFLHAMSRALSLGLAKPIELSAPFSRFHKDEVVTIGRDLRVPLALTLSCMNPQAGDRHCGRCSKCRERHDAFVAAGVADPTDYRDLSNSSA